nr:TMV resistance protein N-like [Ipomoea batatas]
MLTDAARNYELKTVHYNQLPSFHGSASEDALTFIRDFYGIVQHFPLNDLTEDALRMRCFPYTLKDAAKTWFMSLTPGSLQTWPEVYNKFIGMGKVQHVAHSMPPPWLPLGASKSNFL